MYDEDREIIRVGLAFLAFGIFIGGLAVILRWIVTGGV